MRQESPNQGGSFSCGTWEIFNRVSQCVFALILEEHCICKAGQHFDISVIHCEVKSHFKHTHTHLHTVSCGSITVSSGHGLRFFESDTRLT